MFSVSKCICLLLCVIQVALGDDQLNTLSESERKEGWKLLFDGKSLNGWRSYFSAGAFPSNGWTVAEGCIKNRKNSGRLGENGGDLLTIERFWNFELVFEWKIAPGGNSGVKYCVIERQNSPGASMGIGDDGRSAVGPEYQLLDDAKHPDARNGPIRQTGALYSLIPPNDRKRVKPVGEFNRSRIVVRGKHVEHWLNDAKVVEYDLESPELSRSVSASKFGAVPGFATKSRTPILLQDHGDEVWFKNLKIRALE